MVAAIMLQTPAMAEAMDDDEIFMAEIPVGMSATRMPQPLLYSPVSTTIITRDMIKASGFNEIADIFRLVPGFQVAQATGGHYVVAYHGQEYTLASRLEVLIDGRSVYGNILSSVQWNRLGILLDDIEKIEVIRGPNAPVFGANAMVATINIITRQPYAEQGTWLDVTAGSLDTRNISIRHAGYVNKLDYRVSLGLEENKGFDIPPDHGPDFDSSRLATLSYRGTWAPTLRDDLDILWGFTAGDGGTLFPGPEDSFNAHDGDVRDNFQQLRWTRSLPEAAEFYLQFYHNYDKQNDRFDVGPLSKLFDLPPVVIPLLTGGRPDQEVKYFYADGVSERYDLEFQHRPAPGSALHVVWGGGLRLDRLKSKAHLNRKGYIDNPSGRIFGNGEWHSSEKTSLNLGIMVENNDLIGSYGSARLAANYHLSPHQSLRASISSTERSPSIIEKNWDYSIKFSDGAVLNQIYATNIDGDPEHLAAFEVGHTFLSDNASLLVDTKLFRERAWHLISATQDDNFPEPFVHDGSQIAQNADHYWITGLEGEVRWQPRNGDLFSFQYSITRSKREHHRGGTVDPVKTEVIDTPESTGSLLYSHHFQNGFTAGFGVYHRSNIKWLGDGDKLKTQNRVDLRAAKDFQGKGWEGALELIAQNIGADYQEYVNEAVGRTTFETRYFIKTRLSF